MLKKFWEYVKCLASNTRWRDREDSMNLEVDKAARSFLLSPTKICTAAAKICGLSEILQNSSRAEIQRLGCTFSGGGLSVADYILHIQFPVFCISVGFLESSKYYWKKTFSNPAILPEELQRKKRGSVCSFLIIHIKFFCEASILVRPVCLWLDDGRVLWGRKWQWSM